MTSQITTKTIFDRKQELEKIVYKIQLLAMNQSTYPYFINEDYLIYQLELETINNTILNDLYYE